MVVMAEEDGGIEEWSFHRLDERVTLVTTVRRCGEMKVEGFLLGI